MTRPRLLVLLLALAMSPIAQAAGEQARAAATEAMLRGESLGALHLRLGEKAVLELLGKPEKQGKLVLQGADGEYVQEWEYPAKGLRLTMSAGAKKTGPKSIVHLTASAPCALATKRGVKIGSAEAVARKAYAPFLDRESPAEPGTLVAGSVYGGIIFTFTSGKVSRIFFGASAE